MSAFASASIPARALSRLQAEITALLKPDHAAEASARCRDLGVLAADAPEVQGWLSHAYQRLGDFEAMTAAAARATASPAAGFDAERRVVECHVYAGRVDLARERLRAMQQRAAGDAEALLRLSELHVHCGDHEAAHRCSADAVALGRRDAYAWQTLGSTAVALGRIDEAEAAFERAIAQDPLDGDAHVNLAALRTWTPGRHHVGSLTQLLERLPQGHAAETPLCYALAKELEDLGEAALSFGFLKRGADRRRAGMRYRVEGDVQAMAWIREAFDADCLAQRALAEPDPCALFVLGLPRSGTTLVERMLDSHSQVASLGEANALAYAVMGLAGTLGDKQALVQRSARIDPRALGTTVDAALRSHGRAAPRLVDKTPANFLYLGLIHRALPAARVVHLRRHPLDSCLAMYKTLFRMGYPYSYSLEDLGAYYVAYHRLMAHWRTLIPVSFVDLDYEALVEQPEAAMRPLFAYCGLDWEDGCLSFQHNPRPSATASAAQVRQPIHRRSVGRWRQYERQLAPLADLLTRNGIPCG
jgi:tetratricopeptide (TPR) repeat protein